MNLFKSVMILALVLLVMVNYSQQTCDQDGANALLENIASATLDNPVSKATITCEAGYEIAGGTGVAKCVSDNWVTPSFYCVRVCDDFADKVPPNTVLQAITGNTIGSNAIFNCKQGYKVNNGGNEPIIIKCKEDDTNWNWEDYSNECEIADCGSIDSINVPNAILRSHTGTTIGSTAAFTCDERYSVSDGTETIMVSCVESGWEDPSAQCTITECGEPPEAPPGSHFKEKSGIAIDDTATYECDEGYTDGNDDFTEITCLDSGDWEQLDPKCQIKDCGQVPDAPPNSKVQAYTGTTFGETVTYACDEGSDDSDLVSCRSDGTWEHVDLVCDIPDCGEVSVAPDNAQLHAYTGTKVKSTAIYMCNKGYIRSSGSGLAACTDSGSWSEVTLICAKQDCGKLPQAHNNLHLEAYTGTTAGSTATYACNTGYLESAGTGLIECTEDGTWTEVSLTCDIQDCGEQPQAPLNAHLEAYTGTTVGSTATYSCDKGYSKHSGKGQVMCQSNKKWESPSLICQIQDCGQLPKPPPNTRLEAYTGTTAGSTANYVCNEGHTQSAGKGLIKCQDDTTWETITLTCQRQDCGEPPDAPPNTVLEAYTGTTVGKTATYKCNYGYSKSDGKGLIRCKEDTTWEKIELTCQIQDCGDLPSPPPNAHLQAYTGTTSEKTATYTCNSGYIQSSGSGRIRCKDDALWEAISLSCQIQDCGRLPDAPSNAQLQAYTGTTTGSTATYRCNDGYKHSGGKSLIYCQNDTTWEEVTLSCLKQDCGRPPNAPPNAELAAYTGTTTGKTATYTCVPGYSQSHGVSHIECQDDTTWEAVTLTCEIHDCGHLPVAPHNAHLEAYTGTASGKSATYRCNEGYIQSGGTNLVRCQADSTWEIVTIACKKQDCGEPPMAPSNAQLQSYTGTKIGDTAIYTCKPGSVRYSGKGIIICKEDTTWEAVGILCKIQDCGPTPSAPPNAQLQSYTGTSSGSSATYTCNKGYKLSDGSTGSGLILCSDDGKWETIKLTCEIQECGQLPNAPPNSLVRAYTGTTIGSTALYTCDPNYMQTGKSLITCQSDLTWEAITLSCQARTQLSQTSDTVHRNGAVKVDNGCFNIFLMVVLESAIVMLLNM